MDLARPLQRLRETQERSPEQLGARNSAEYPVAPRVEERLRWSISGDLVGVVEVIVVVRAVPHQGERVGEGLAHATGATDTLLVVETLGRNIGHHHRAQRANVYANFHRCCHAEHIDAVACGVLSWCRQESALEDALAFALDVKRLGLSCEFTNSQSARRQVCEPCKVVRVVGCDLLLDQATCVAAGTRTYTG